VYFITTTTTTKKVLGMRDDPKTSLNGRRDMTGHLKKERKKKGVMPNFSSRTLGAGRQGRNNFQTSVINLF
jgi:hypothetical protein